MLIKFAEASEITDASFQNIEKLAADIDLDIERRMVSFAQQLKVIAPRANDFLYFTCVMMHAAEASLYDDEGNIRKLANGKPLEAVWEKVGKEGLKWVCNDPHTRPYKNNNNDIFPEPELKVAYKKWVGRPLCLDHQSQSVDKIRGVIVDTVWDDKRKRVIALCALDKKNYPDLAHKVSSGVATNVSMGTAVGRAVCTECHTVARTERDFCKHMQNKTCYGEINLDLSPIEVSLVVSGADPKAKVKHIIARDLTKAADMLSDYIQKKASVGADELKGIQNDLKSLGNKVADLIADTERDSDSSDAAGPTRSTEVTEDAQTSGVQLNAPEAFPTYASELQQTVLGLQRKIAQLQETVSHKLSNKSEDSNMTRKNAYYQGTEEPKTYPVDPLAGKARLEDKYLHGPGDFPNVGDVDGLMNDDEEVKRQLQRLGAEERAMFREAALKKAKANLARKKMGYYQGTTEPTPGKPQYKPDKGLDIREDDKYMLGPKPFPGVGNVEGLYDDDLATKKKLLRADLSAKFRKVIGSDGEVDKARSRWEVYANDEVILSATVNQISKGNSEDLYSVIATKDFGTKMLRSIKKNGFEATRNSLLKRGGAPAAPPPPPAPGGDAGAPPPPPAPGGDAPADAGSPGEPPDSVDKPGDVGGIVEDLKGLNDEMKEKIDDLEQAQGATQGDAQDNLAEVPPAGEDSFQEGEAGAAPPPPKTSAELQMMRKTVNGMLQEGFTETIGNLKRVAKEINTATRLYASSYGIMDLAQRKYLNSLTAESVREAKGILAEASRLQNAFVKYAYGTAEIEKRAGCKNCGDSSMDDDDAYPEEFEGMDEGSQLEDPDDVAAPTPTGISEEDTGDSPFGEEELGGEGWVGEDFDVVGDEDEGIEDAPGGDVEYEDEDEDEDLDVEGESALDELEGNMADTVLPQGSELHLKGGDTIKAASLNTKAGRAQARVKLAQKGLSFNELSADAHPKGSVEIPNIQIKPSVPESKFHVSKDIQKAMLQLANMPPKVRKQAESIQEMVSSGKLAATDVDELTKHGVDKDAVAYWKAMWGEAKDSESKEFATKLTTEHVKQKAAADLEIEKARIKRAYSLAATMEEKGLIDKTQVEDQVGEILKWNDDGFNSIKNIVAKQPSMTRQASLPNVGLLNSGDVILPGLAAQGSSVAVGGTANEVKNYFDSYFANKKL